MSRNLAMAERIEAASVAYPFSFVIAGDSGAWPDPTADAIFAQLGIDPKTELQTPTGRPIQLFREGKVVEKLVG